ncbi:hypothetical protein tloyanaT_13190 [Thalassotalea loyana]|uniref:Uncharacterized protein n=1 Tax=Thalassotalea loyana TaxID=280483 RepID=A0ABQ6HEB2_9GAMM|nr:hypothetical protein [Thalassotalea loyana]GLX85067.1 hypothetical protein tloyanaT_13190 [Thalassotalea loyana]
MKQLVSKDYLKLYELVVTHGFDVPCRLDYSFRDDEHVYVDYAVCRKSERDELSISIGVRGTTYTQASEFQVNLSNGKFNNVKDMFIRDCEVNNVEWFDTFTQK